VVPREAAETIWREGAKAVFDTAGSTRSSAVTKHDVIAF
jgi:adenylosuccinate lyase